jgi:ABC-type antimicrobial peptide transport system permease subunit
MLLYPAANVETSAIIAPLGEDLVRHSRSAVLVLFAAVILVLVIACVNVSNLMLTRAIGQRHEIALRTALGASRSQIMADLLTRGLVLGLLGGAGGLLLGNWTRDALVAMAPDTIPRLHDVSVNVTVLAFALTVSVAAGVLVGLLPAFT